MTTWIRVEDNDTGNQHDLAEPRAKQLEERGAVTILDQEKYPPISGANARPRPAKVRTDKAGQPASRQAEHLNQPAETLEASEDGTS